MCKYILSFKMTSVFLSLKEKAHLLPRDSSHDYESSIHYLRDDPVVLVPVGHGVPRGHQVVPRPQFLPRFLIDWGYTFPSCSQRSRSLSHCCHVSTGWKRNVGVQSWKKTVHVGNAAGAGENVGTTRSNFFDPDP